MDKNILASDPGCKEFDVLANFEIVHLGINGENKELAERAAKLFSLITGRDISEAARSFFCGSNIEIMFTKGRGAHGHIALGTDDVEKAVAYLRTKGFTFDEDSRTYNESNQCNFIYMNEEIAGFAIHLLLR